MFFLKHSEQIHMYVQLHIFFIFVRFFPCSLMFLTKKCHNRTNEHTVLTYIHHNIHSFRANKTTVIIIIVIIKTTSTTL